MPQQLILDCAYPQADVNQWIATLRMAGASGCMAYIYDLQIPGNRWTPDYCHAIQEAGFGLLAVYVWGPTYPAIGHVRDVTAAYGIASGPVMGDIEAGSMPSEAYFSGWCSDLRSNGYTPVAYGTASTLDRYRRYADKAFLASYIQRQIQPIPDLAGVSYDGWQYANSLPINGVEVDASVTSIPLIGGETDLTPEQDELLKAIANKVLADPGYRFGADPGDTSSPYYPGTANAWRWKYSDWYVDQHPELHLPAGPQSGAVPGTGAYTTQWGFVDEIAESDKDAPRLADILAAVKAIPAGPPGAKGDPGPQGPPAGMSPHTHSVTGVTSSAS